MKNWTSMVAVALMVGSVAVGGVEASATDAEPEWKGDKHAMPSAYPWLDDSTPSDTYSVAIVRGKKAARVLRNLGKLRKELGVMTPAEAESYYFDHLDKYYSGPPVVQVEQLGRAVVIYQPYGFRAWERIRKLSTRGTVAEFSTTVEYDTYATVARRGKVIRQFDVFFKPPTKGALPEEEGLDFGARKQNPFRTAWAFNERLTRIHLTQEWFEADHPTYVLAGKS